MLAFSLILAASMTGGEALKPATVEKLSEFRIRMYLVEEPATREPWWFERAW